VPRARPANISTQPEPVLGAADSLPTAVRARLSRRLLAWFDRNQRPLPWRADRDPYRIWVSEVMLQQTLVATVIPYFERFVSTFPGVAELAAADEQDVLRLWEGLGYYRRARDLHRAARQLVAEQDSQIPNNPSVLATLPGFGRYTCNAVLSQAFDRQLPILEANSQRVLSRLFARREDPRRGEARRWLWRAAEELLPRKRAGAFNQALMELGALVCTPTVPKCDTCPLDGICAARRLGLQESIPARAIAPAVTAVREAAVVIWRDGRVLLAQRPANASRWAGLWEFPHGPLLDDESPADAARRIAKELTGIRTRPTAELETVRHTITRYQITLIGFEAQYRAGEFRPGSYAQACWALPEELQGYPVSSPQRRLAKLLSAACRQRRLF
jgi:A/G-specific adenine glycosylase